MNEGGTRVTCRISEVFVKQNRVRLDDHQNAQSSLFFLLRTLVAENKRGYIFNLFNDNCSHVIRLHLTPSVLLLCFLKTRNAIVIIIQSHELHTILLEWDGN